MDLVSRGLKRAVFFVGLVDLPLFFFMFAFDFGQRVLIVKVVVLTVEVAFLTAFPYLWKFSMLS